MIRMVAQIQKAEEVIAFWQEAGPSRWFARDDKFDTEIAERFGDLIEPAISGELDEWQQTAVGTMALILVLDQFSRNLFRDSARAYAQDDKAIEFTKLAIERGFDNAFDVPLKRFIFMPFMHAEDLDLQEQLIELCAKTDDTDGAKWGEMHADIIRRFGRFPHRNELLGRTSTAEELAFLEEGGFAG